MDRSGIRGKLPAMVTAGPISIWLIIFVLLPLVYVFVISFMSRGTYGGIDWHFTFENYTMLLQPLYLKIIWKSLKLAFLTTAMCLIMGYPLAYWIAQKPAKSAAKWLLLVMIP